MMEYAGFINLIKDKARYPVISADDILSLRSASNGGNVLILLSSEPYPFGQKHIEELKEQFPGFQFLLVDGEMFSWYGSRLEKAPAYFLNLHNQITA
jgi:hypothetical protein